VPCSQHVHTKARLRFPHHWLSPGAALPHLMLASPAVQLSHWAPRLSQLASRRSDLRACAVCCG